MSKFTVSAVIGVASLAIRALYTVLKFVDVIRDLCDDGKVNDSIPSNFSEKFQKIQEALQSVQTELLEIVRTDSKPVE